MPERTSDNELDTGTGYIKPVYRDAIKEPLHMEGFHSAHPDDLKTPGPVYLHLDSLEQRIKQLDDALAALIHRIDPALGSEPDFEGRKHSDHTGMSPLRQRIAESDDYIMRMIEVVESVTKRVEL